MADDPTQNEILQALMGVGDQITKSFEEVGKQIVSSLSKAGIASAQELVGNIENGAKVAKDRISQIDIFANAFDSETVSNNFKNTIDKLERIYNEKVGTFELSVGLEEDSLSDVFNALDVIANKEYGIKLTTYFAADSVFKGIEQIGSAISSKESEVLRFTKTAFENLRTSTGMISTEVTGAGDRQTRSFGSLSQASKVYKQEVMGLMDAWGTSGDEAERAINQMLSSGLVVEQIGNLSAKMADGTENVSGLEAAFAAAKSTGLTYTEVGETLNKMIRGLGVSSEEATQKFELLARVQAGSTMQIGDVKNAVMGAADSMKFYGNNIDSAASIYKAFLKTFKDGEEVLAAPIFRKVTDGIANMDTGMRAFLGLTTQIGTGGGGAIGGALEVEQALATGEGMEQVMNGIQDTVEKLSGAPMLTRQEAIETGQQQQYFIQRELLGKQLKMNDPAELERVMQMFQQQNVDGIRQALTTEGKGGGFDRGRLAEVATVEAGGGTQQALNRLQGARRRMQEGFVDELIEAGGSLNKQIAEGFKAPLEKLETIFSSENFTERIKQELAINEAKSLSRENQKSLTNAQEALMRGEGRSGKAKTSEEMSSAREVLDRTSRETLGQMGSRTVADNRTTRDYSEVMTSSSEAYFKTQRELSSSMNQLSEVMDRTSQRYVESFNAYSKVMNLRPPTSEEFEVLEAPKLESAVIKEMFEDVDKAISESLKNADSPKVEEQEVKVIVKLEVDPSGNINIVQMANEIAEKKARSIVAEQSTQQE